MTGGSSAFWVFGYCIWYYAYKLHITGFVSGLLFFSYSFLACAVYGLLTGTVGFLAAYAFVRRVYRYDLCRFDLIQGTNHVNSAIKVD